MLWVWIGVGVVAVLVVLVAVMCAIGSRLPEEHVAGVTLRLKQPPEAVWAVIADTAGYAAWAPGVTRVERLADRDGHEAWRQHMGRNSFVLETTRSDRGRLLVRTIADDHKMFSGRWEYAIAPEVGGCAVTLTEYGRIPSPLPRFMMRYLFSETMYVRKHLAGLAKKFGEEGVTA
jgi:uncharacterized protein YndB with AHSA1/START domain